MHMHACPLSKDIYLIIGYVVIHEIIISLQVVSYEFIMQTEHCVIQFWIVLLDF